MVRHRFEDDDDVDTPSTPRRPSPEDEATSMVSSGSSTTNQRSAASSNDQRRFDSPSTTRSSNRTMMSSIGKQPVPDAYDAAVAQKELAMMEGSAKMPSRTRGGSQSNDSRLQQSSRGGTYADKSRDSTYPTKLGGSSNPRDEIHPGAQAIGRRGESGEEDADVLENTNHFVAIASPSAGPDGAPIKAEVYQPEAEIDARARHIENRLREELIENTPKAVAIEADHGGSKRRRFWIICVILLLVLVGGVVGAVVGIMSGRSSGSPASPPAPTLAMAPTPPPTNPFPSVSPSVFIPVCTLCVDGSEANLGAEISRGFTCIDLLEDLALLHDASDHACLSGQATGWHKCSCPTLPPSSSTSNCSAACPADSRPPAFDSKLCRDFETFVEVIGLDTEDCTEVLAQVPENCTCSVEIEQLRGVLSSVSNEEDLLDTTTPQFQAMLWLANEDPANLDISATSQNEVRMRYFGALLWYSLGGQRWPKQYNFMSADGVCEWNDGTSGLRCSQSDLFTEISIEQNSLSGAFPGLELAAFTTIETIQLAENDIAGSFPSSINMLSSLRILSIYGNVLFGGTLSPSLFELRRLSILLLNDCSFSGSLPSNIGDATSLTIFSAPNNDLTGTFPVSLSQMTSLTGLWLDRNQFVGPLPPLDGLIRLSSLNFLANQLTGTIPAHYGQNPRMERMELGSNRFTGTIPDFSLSVSLQDLGVESNRLSGNMYRFFNTTPTANLDEIWFSNNLLTGSIPSSIARYTRLDQVWLFKNPLLQGNLPTQIGLLTGMAGTFDVSETGIGGILPTELGRLTSLMGLDVSDSFFTGVISSTIGEMTALTFLDVSSNRLTGTIPTQLANLQNLRRVSFGDNLFTGTVPSALATLPDLELFVVDDNLVIGSLDPLCDAGIESVYADCEAPAEIACDCCVNCQG